MELIQAIMTRRSVRHYLDQPVSAADLDTLLRAAMQAPSAGNAQPWHFIVMNDREMLNMIADFHPYAKMLRQAPLAILVCGDESLEKHPGYWPQDCSAATQNLLLAAHALGLGAVWIGVHPNPRHSSAVGQLAGLPEKVHPFALIAVGYPAEQPAPADRFRQERVRTNRW